MQAALDLSLYRQSGVIPYRFVRDTIEILLITSIRRARWIIPKGVIEPGLTPAESACQEAFEEAGIVGDISSTPIGEYQYVKWGGVCTVTVFPLQVHTVLETWPEAALRKRRWMPVHAAVQVVEEPELQRLLSAVPASVGATHS